MVILNFMEEETSDPQANNSMMYYLVGAGVVVAIAAGIYFLRPQQSGVPETTTPIVEQAGQLAPPQTGPISGLACEQQYYNPVVGLPQYYLSVEGADTTDTKSITCDFTVSVAGTTVATDTAQATLTAAPQRNGQTFGCTTKALNLAKSVATKVDVQVKNDSKNSVACSKVFQFP